MSRDNPWKTTSTRIAYENPWIRVREDQVIGPDGKPSLYGIVECNMAVGVVALTEAREVVLVGQYRYPIRRWSWEIIEGGTHDGEDPLAAAQRELAEEAGLVAASWEPLGPRAYMANAHSLEGGQVYLARQLEPTDAKPDACEILELARVPLSECVQRALAGDIDDALSIVGILRAHHRLAEGR